MVKLIDLRMKKIIRRALRNASSTGKGDPTEGMTDEERKVYEEILSAVTGGRESILRRLSGRKTERPLTGKKDIAQQYAAVRLLDSVPMFIGVDGRRYLLQKDDVVMLPAVHAKNLINRNLAHEIIERKSS
jgi:DNA replication factor GINS